MVLGLGCAHGYVDPDPAAGPTARVVIENPDADSTYSLMAEAGPVINVFELTPDGTRTYLGTLSTTPARQEIGVRADRPTVLEFLLAVTVPVGIRYSCKVERQLVAAAGATYRAIASDNLRKHCTLRLFDASGREIERSDPVYLERR
jgi:hypothetical protein